MRLPALVRDNAADRDGVPRALSEKMAEPGWMGLVVPEEIGRAVVPDP